MTTPEIEIQPRANRDPLDVNGDGRITSADADLIIEHLQGKRPLHDHFDVDQDGIVKALDALLVINFIDRRQEGNDKK
ncbi:MAG: hypothetical protein IH991_09920 [Planctomycetes bacterium]|nr:hypothetical protein [Planctomycetota bacterium]